MNRAKRNGLGRVHWLTLVGCLVAASCAGKHLDDGSDNDGSGGDGSAGESNTAGAAGDPGHGGAAGASAGGAGEAGKGGQGEAGHGGRVNGGAGGEGGAEFTPVVWGEGGVPEEVIVYRVRASYNWGGSDDNKDDDMLWISRTDGSERHPLFLGSEPCLSPDGTRLAYAFEGSIWMANADGTDRHAVTASGGEDRSPTWSDDGESLAFERAGTLFRMSVTGEDVVPLLPDGVKGSLPDWRGSKIVYHGSGGIWLKDAGDAAAGEKVADAAAAALSPDATRILLTFHDEAWVEDLDGSNQVEVVEPGDATGECGVRAPFWSTDGAYVLLTRSCSDSDYGTIEGLVKHAPGDEAQWVDNIDPFLEPGSKAFWGKYAP